VTSGKLSHASLLNATLPLARADGFGFCGAVGLHRPVERLPRVFYRTKPMEFSGLVSFVYVKSVHVDQEFGKFCGAPYVAEGDYSVVEDPASGPAHRRLGECRAPSYPR